MKILDQIPIWKTLSGLPKRLADMEERVMLLESQHQVPPAVPGEPCASCGARSLRRTSRIKATSGPFAVFGRFNEVWTCSSCGVTEERDNVK